MKVEDLLKKDKSFEKALKSLEENLVRGRKRKYRISVACPWKEVNKNFPKIRIPADLPRGAIVGRVDLADCVKSSRSKWFFGPYGFVLTNPVEFEKPIPFKGKLGLFEVELEKKKEKYAAHL
jgi:hypothetical protein